MSETPSARRQTVSGPEPDAAGLRLGARIRELRTSHGLTLVQLARSTDLSHPFLSQIERGLAQPSLGSLRRIAIALETSPIELIAAAETDAGDAAGGAVEVHHRGDGALSAEFASGSARMLAAGSRPFHPMHLESAAADPGEYFVHGEDEFFYVLDGAVRADLAGEIHDLGPGDSLYYRGGVAHRWWSADGAPIRMLVVKQGQGTVRVVGRGDRPAPSAVTRQTASTAPRAL